MLKNSQDKENSTPIENENDTAENKEAEKDKEIKPRRRMITKNPQLIVSAAIPAAALLFLIVWKMFFNQSLIGQWHFQTEGEYIETSEIAESVETGDNVKYTTVQYTRDVIYDFRKDGVCAVTMGTVTIEGEYTLGSMEGYGNVVSASVSYEDSEALMGTYSYRVEGNIFTGKKLILENVYYDEDPQTLEHGKGEDPLTPFENAKTDTRFIGRWYDSQNNITYDFNSNGEMTYTADNGITVRNVYTVSDDGTILFKYVGDSEINYSLSYEFEDSTLYLNGFALSRLDGR